jgi:hypothetical protein
MPTCTNCTWCPDHTGGTTGDEHVQTPDPVCPGHPPPYFPPNYPRPKPHPECTCPLPDPITGEWQHDPNCPRHPPKT